MQTTLPSTIPAAVAKSRRTRPDIKLTILVSFTAGILLGVPLTFGALFLQQVSQPLVEEKLSAAEVISSPLQTLLLRDEESRPGHPAANAVRSKSGLGPPSVSIHGGGGASRRRGKKRNNSISRHASDFSQAPYVLKGSGTVNPAPTSFEDLADGVFWTELAESTVPRGFGEEHDMRWRSFLNASDVLRIEEGCGRMQNRLVTLTDGRTSCCRYRHNNDQIQGEIFSFYLGRLLNIENLSPSALALVDPRTRRWSAAASQMALARWNPERPAVLTQFIENLQPAFVPKHFRNSKTRRLHPVQEDFRNLTSEDIPELVQWSDLIIFDYLTANLDRVVNNMYNEQWNPGMMSQPTHNLAKTPGGLLLFLDNESGLLHGYRLLEKYEHFHRSLLDVLCLFRKRTILALQALHQGGNVDHLLKQTFTHGDPGMSDWLPFLPDRSVRTLKERIAQVLRQVQRCRERFEPVT